MKWWAADQDRAIVEEVDREVALAGHEAGVGIAAERTDEAQLGVGGQDLGRVVGGRSGPLTAAGQTEPDDDQDEATRADRRGSEHETSVPRVHRRVGGRQTPGHRTSLASVRHGQLSVASALHS